MKQLREIQVKDREDFIKDYIGSLNAATGSEVDANSNVTQKTVATMEAELYKPYTIQINRQLVKEKLEEMNLVDDLPHYYESDIRRHIIYVHDETSLKPYCASITLYPFLLEGTKCIGGVSGPPTNLQSFCGSFVNLVYQVASNFAGAIATVEFLHYFDYFARKQYGKDYLVTNEREIKQELQGVVYGLNQPASARGDQSVFWNISVLDRPYMKELFGGFFYPDGTQPDFDSLMKLQKFFMEWFRIERTKELLTFPVLTASLLTEGKNSITDRDTMSFVDYDFMSFCAEQLSKGHSFFVYMSDSVDSLASCCRLRNELADNTFSYSLGAGGVVTGSAQVITINMNRLIQDAYYLYGDDQKKIDEVIRGQLSYVHAYLLAHKAVYRDYINAGMLPAYTAGFMDLDKQFLTVGVNGVAEAAEFLGYTVGNNKEYKKWLGHILGIFKSENKKALEKYGCRFNTEFVPAENLGVKNAKWDREEGYEVSRDCYNSYFYLVEDEDTNILDKFSLYSEDVCENLDGGSALHLNLAQLPTVAQAKHLFTLAMRKGTPYWTINVLCTICNDCGKIDPVTRTSCEHCGSKNIDYGTRVIGYLKRISNFSEARQKEAFKRFYI
ncbi:MAG: anaerobic ribonucleoside-triphosphate reductase [Acidaminococcus intestini]|uniref:Anaerobic ribonucleoside-triphosphate reductase n=1 Tax=Acidaminococcus intestini TaxID=187327 RepID=A0A943EG99_9FIRM|nr:anaerobic ribonucleoside-triphosphate reductase [Acidaminococcus intestini]